MDYETIMTAMGTELEGEHYGIVDFFNLSPEDAVRLKQLAIKFWQNAGSPDIVEEQVANFFLLGYVYCMYVQVKNPFDIDSFLRVRTKE
jgi:hypothetical protein